MGPRINQLRDLFVIESGAQTPLRTLCVLTACEYRECLTQQRVCLGGDGVLAGTRCYVASGARRPLASRCDASNSGWSLRQGREHPIAADRGARISNRSRRLGRERTRLAVLLAAVDQVRGSLGLVTALYPRK